MDRLDFGKELIRIRKTKGLTQAEVAEKCNITIRTIQRIESGAVKPRSSTIKIISEFLEVDFFEISNQNSNLKNHTILWYLKDIFNLKTNTMKKISILSTSVLILTFIGISIFNTEAQSKTSNKKREVALESQNKKVDFSKDFDKFRIADNYVFVTKNNKQGLMTLNGKVIVPCKYDRFEIKGRYITTTKNYKFGLMNLDGKVIVPCEFDRYEIKDRYITTTKNYKFGLMNLDGETIIPCEYDNYEIKGRYITTTKNHKFGLMDLDGKSIIPCEYDTMKIEGAIAIVTKNGKTEQIRI
ncbi:MAG: WG repeat-containing protein [Flavobacteriaceae bacterium]|nr:WG repeat-containing protein [Flavobacteriaceae bacterium]